MCLVLKATGAENVKRVMYTREKFVSCCLAPSFYSKNPILFLSCDTSN